MGLRATYEPTFSPPGWYQTTQSLGGWYDPLFNYGTNIFPVGPGVTTAWTTATTAYNATGPSTLVEGDLLVIQFINAATSGSFSTVPSGWTAAISPTFIASGNMIAVYYHFVTSAEAASPPTSFNFVWSASLTGNAQLMAYRNVDTTTPLDVAAVTPHPSGGSATNTVASLTTVTDKAFIIGGAELQSANTQSVAGPLTGGWTGKTTACLLSAGRGGISGYLGEISPAGSTGTVVFTQTLALDGLAYTLALRPKTGTAYSQALTAALSFSDYWTRLNAEDSGFEGGTVGNWSGLSGATVANSTLRSHSGTRSLQLTWPTVGAYGSGCLHSGANFQTIIGQTYTIGAWVYVESGSPDTYIGAYFVASGPTVTTKDAWAWASCTFTATGTATLITFGQTQASTAGQLMYIDDIQIQDTSLARQTNRPLTGGLSFSGSIKRSIGRVLTGGLAFVGSLAKTQNLKRALAGGLSFTGALTKSTSRALSGGLSFVGALAAGKQFARALTAALSFTGSQTRRTAKRLSSGVSFTGQITRAFGRVLAGGLAFTGSTARQTRRAFSAVLSFAGSVATFYSAGSTAYTKALTAALSFSGSTSRQTAKGLSGALSFAGQVARRSAKGLAGGLSFVGSLAAGKQFTRALTAGLSFTGALTRRTARSLTGGVSPTGTLSRSLTRPLSASLGFVGVLTKRTTRSLAGGLSFVGSLASGKQFTRALTAGLSFVGSQSRRTGKALTAGLSFVGSVRRGVSHGMSGVLSFTGSNVRAIGKRLTVGVLSFVGSVTTSRVYARAFTAALSFTGSTSRSIGKALGGAVAFVGTSLTTAAHTLVGLPITTTVRSSANLIRARVLGRNEPPTGDQPMTRARTAPPTTTTRTGQGSTRRKR